MEKLMEMEKAELDVAKENRKMLEQRYNSMDNIWGHSGVAKEGKRAAMTMLSTKTGMYASIPLVCKGGNCPYQETCTLLQYDLCKIGEPCPNECAMIEVYYANYSDEFDLDHASFTDKTLVKELIDCEIKLERCQALMNKEQTQIKQEFAGSTEQGEVFYKDEISKAFELYERNFKKKEKILHLLMATKSDIYKMGEKDTSVKDMFNDAIGADFIVEERPEDL